MVPPAPGTSPLPATPQGLAGVSNHGGRRDIWLSEPFRCRAISTVRLRKCRFEETDNGHQLRFNKKDVICDDVVFDESGDPSELRGCHSSWLRVPSNNKLRPDNARRIWSGSHRGWSWKGSGGGRYCCPGLWLEAPKSLL